MSKQDRGEHSNDQELHEHEKPLKKARFLWEVKGKHHLKETHQDNAGQNIINKPQKSETTTQANANPRHEENCEQNECCNCLQQFLSKSEDIMDNIEDDLNSNEVQDEFEFPVGLLAAETQTEDYYLRKWQAKQIAKAFVDNTINSVLETWATRPVDATDFIENCRNDGQVEDDAILMAIQEHGLRSRTKSRQESRLEISDDLKEQMASFLVKENKEASDDCSSNLSQIEHYRQREDSWDFINAAVSAAIDKEGLS